MQRAATKLYSLAAPLALLPIMNFSFSEVGDFLRGTDFRTLISEIVTQLLSGLSAVIISAFSQALFGGLAG